MRRHAFDETVTDVVRVAQLMGFPPKFFSSELALKCLLGFVPARCRKNVPIRLIPQTVKSSDDPSIKAEFCSIETPREHAEEIITLLMEVLKQNPRAVILARWRHSHPESFDKAVKNQMIRFKNTHVVPIPHCSEAVMFHLGDKIRAVEGVVDVVPSKRISTAARQNVLVHRKKHKEARAKLSKSLRSFVNELPRDVLPIAGQPRPMIPGVSDEMSETANSIASASVGSWATLDLSDVSPIATAAQAPLTDSETPPPQVPQHVGVHRFRTFAEVLESTPGQAPTTAATSDLASSDEVAQLRAEMSQMKEQHAQQLKQLEESHQTTVATLLKDNQQIVSSMMSRFETVLHQMQESSSESVVKSPIRKRQQLDSAPVQPMDTAADTAAPSAETPDVSRDLTQMSVDF